MSVKSNIQKGKELENYVCDKLASHGIDPRATRQPGSGNGKRKGDINTDIGWAIECKNTKAFRFKDAADQVARDGMGYNKECIVWHPPQRPLDSSVVIINFQDFLDLLKYYKDHQGRETILDKYQVKRNLERAVFHLKEVVKDL